MRFKKRQRVRITDDESVLETIDLPPGFAGQIVTLEDCSKPTGHLHFKLDGCRWYIEEDMVEPLEEQMFFQFNSGSIKVRRSGNGSRSKRGRKAKTLTS